MPRLFSRSSRMVRYGLWLFVPLIALGWSLTCLAAYSQDTGPQLSVSTDVAQRGVAVTVVLTGFAANQPITVTVTASSDAAPGAAVATLSATVDRTGTGSVTVLTNSLSSGNYLISAAGTDGVTLTGVQAAFAVIDPGTIGPWIVRSAHPATDDGE